MQRELEAFAKAPTRSNYLTARAALLSASERILGAEDFAPLLALLEAGDYAAVSEAIASLPPIAALSPGVHWIAAEAADAAGDAQDRELEQFLLAACLEAILSTGDGTEDAPYVVVCAMDERHVCEMLGVVRRSQALVNWKGKALDVVDASDGRRVCFDVSALVPLPAPQPLLRKGRGAAARRQTAACRQAAKERLSRTPR